jgi:small-conductance mechanosensitive channel
MHSENLIEMWTTLVATTREHVSLISVALFSSFFRISSVNINVEFRAVVVLIIFLSSYRFVGRLFAKDRSKYRAGNFMDRNCSGEQHHPPPFRIF